jgi:SH3 domain protein
MRSIVTLLSVVLLFPVVVLGKSLYVKDTTNEALVRTGPSLTNRILVILKPGQEVSLEKEEGDYYVVTTPNGVQGYVLKYLMTDKSSAGTHLREVEPKAESHAEIEPKAPQNTEPEQKTQQRILELETKTQEQEKELTALREERGRLEAAKKQAEVAAKQAEVTARQQAELASRVQEQQSAVQGSEARLWFLAGAGVLLVGVFLGRVWGAGFRRQRQSNLRLNRW